jgi:hypothetical protein
MTAHQVCPRRHPYPYDRVRTVADDGSRGKPVPDRLAALGRRAVTDAHGPDAVPVPPYDIALIDFYDDDARRGMHGDGHEQDERTDTPVVSPSPGDTCVFCCGGTGTRAEPYPMSTRAAVTCPASAARPGSPGTGCPASARVPARSRRVTPDGRTSPCGCAAGNRRHRPPRVRIMGDSPS